MRSPQSWASTEPAEGGKGCFLAWKKKTHSFSDTIVALATPPGMIIGIAGSATQKHLGSFVSGNEPDSTIIGISLFTYGKTGREYPVAISK